MRSEGCSRCVATVRHSCSPCSSGFWGPENHVHLTLGIHLVQISWTDIMPLRLGSCYALCHSDSAVKPHMTSHRSGVAVLDSSGFRRFRRTGAHSTIPGRCNSSYSERAALGEGSDRGVRLAPKAERDRWEPSLHKRKGEGTRHCHVPCWSVQHGALHDYKTKTL